MTPHSEPTQSLQSQAGPSSLPQSQSQQSISKDGSSRNDDSSSAADVHPSRSESFAPIDARSQNVDGKSSQPDHPQADSAMATDTPSPVSRPTSVPGQQIFSDSPATSPDAMPSSNDARFAETAINASQLLSTHDELPQVDASQEPPASSSILSSSPGHALKGPAVPPSESTPLKRLSAISASSKHSSSSGGAFTPVRNSNTLSSSSWDQAGQDQPPKPVSRPPSYIPDPLKILDFICLEN